MESASRRIGPIVRLLRRHYPRARTALEFGNPLEILVATILAAQCTDERVNTITPGLFRRYPTAADLARADRAELEGIIRSAGFFRNKAKSILGAARQDRRGLRRRRPGLDGRARHPARGRPQNGQHRPLGGLRQSRGHRRRHPCRAPRAAARAEPRRGPGQGRARSHGARAPEGLARFQRPPRRARPGPMPGPQAGLPGVLPESGSARRPGPSSPARSADEPQGGHALGPARGQARRLPPLRAPLRRRPRPAAASAAYERTATGGWRRSSTARSSPPTSIPSRRNPSITSCPARRPSRSPPSGATSAAASARTGRSPRRRGARAAGSRAEPFPPEGGRPGGPRRGLPEHLLYLHRADDLLRIRLRYGPSGPRGGAPQQLRHQRLHDRRGPGDDPLRTSTPPTSTSRRSGTRPIGRSAADAWSPCSTRSG